MPKIKQSQHFVRGYRVKVTAACKLTKCGLVLVIAFSCFLCSTIKFIEKVIDRLTQTPLCGFTFATQKPLVKTSL